MLVARDADERAALERDLVAYVTAFAAAYLLTSWYLQHQTQHVSRDGIGRAAGVS